VGCFVFLVKVIGASFSMAVITLSSWFKHIISCSYYNYREVCRFGMFWNTVLWRIFGTKGREILRGWRKLYNERLANLYSSTDVTSFNYVMLTKKMHFLN